MIMVDSGELRVWGRSALCPGRTGKQHSDMLPQVNEWYGNFSEAEWAAMNPSFRGGLDFLMNLLGVEGATAVPVPPLHCQTGRGLVESPA